MTFRVLVSSVVIAVSLAVSITTAPAQDSRLSIKAGDTARILANYIVRSRRCNLTEGDMESYRLVARAVASGNFAQSTFQDYIDRAVRVENDLQPPECKLDALATSRSLYNMYKEELLAML
jgi:hypothetical protein